MTPYTEAQKNSIAKNVLAACKNIDKLNGPSYRFLNLCSGFIAHYDINGFKGFYSEHSLQKDIEANARANQWHNFRSNDSGFDYYQSKRDIYNKILGGLVARECLDSHFGNPIEFLRVNLTITKGA